MTGTTTTTLSEQLREETRQAHDRAEHSMFMEQLLNGDLDAAAFTALQEQAYLFYSALEDAVAALAGDSRLDSVDDRGLDRRARLAADLAALGGTVDADPLPETAAYVAELQRIARDGDVPGLVAHHYTRYLGDLAGGQVIGRLMGRHYDVPSSGLNFYDFPEIGKPKPYRDGYRARLDAADFSASEKERLLAAAVEAFAFNSAVFAGLERTRNVPAATD